LKRFNNNNKKKKWGSEKWVLLTLLDVGKKKTCCFERSKALPTRPYGKEKPQRIYVLYKI
jgi:hypothetical protein